VIFNANVMSHGFCPAMSGESIFLLRMNFNWLHQPNIRNLPILPDQCKEFSTSDSMVGAA
jgi:hypothetical protein